MSISTLLEFWNTAPSPDSVHVITHSRRKFYNGRDITWYEFSIDGTPLHELDHEEIIPVKFLKVPETNFYEFGGDDEEARKTLEENGFTLIIKGEDV